MEVSARTVNELYREMWWKIETSGIQQISRNGPVISIPAPVIMSLTGPTQRILTCPVRDANPFFHIAEVVWMFAGSNDVTFPALFNSRYREYADPGTDQVWGAYGHRWVHHWDIDQIKAVIDRLNLDRGDRQAVISMWDPLSDLLPDPHNDRPCNTQILFRAYDEKGVLDMLVVNRSNDMVWGALGANVVHFTYLHELIARSCNMQMGVYRVMTNNLHVYPNMPRFKDIMLNGLHFRDKTTFPAYPLLHEGEFWTMLRKDCEAAVRLVLSKGDVERKVFSTKWMQDVAGPMMSAYLVGPRNHVLRIELLQECKDQGWRTAGREWLERRLK